MSFVINTATTDCTSGLQYLGHLKSPKISLFIQYPYINRGLSEVCSHSDVNTTVFNIIINLLFSERVQCLLYSQIFCSQFYLSWPVVDLSLSTYHCAIYCVLQFLSRTTIHKFIKRFLVLTQYKSRVFRLSCLRSIYYIYFCIWP